MIYSNDDYASKVNKRDRKVKKNTSPHVPLVFIDELCL